MNDVDMGFKSEFTVNENTKRMLPVGDIGREEIVLLYLF